MSRIGYIQKELSQAQDEERDPELSEADIRWAVEFGRWDLLDQAGVDRDEAVQMVHGEEAKAPQPEFNTVNTPSGGADNPSVVKEGSASQRASVVDDEDGEELPAYSEMRKADLQAEAASRGLSTDGNVKELIARLEENDAQQEAE